MSERGEAGVAGRQGEAGVSGPQGEVGREGPVGIGVPGKPGKPGMPGPAGRPGGRGREGRGLTNTQVTAVFLFVVVAFLVLSIRSEFQQRRIDRNSHMIAVTQYEQCQLRNAGTRRQNMLIDSAIAAEKRKPKPDVKRIEDLTNFRGATPDCGPKP